LLWQCNLRRLLYPHSMLLLCPLGRWLLSGPSLNRQWKCYHSRQTSELYMFKYNKYEVHDRVRRNIYQYTTTVDNVPPDAVPADVDLNQTIRLLSRTGCIHQLPPFQPSTFSDYILTLPPWEAALFEHLNLTQDIYSFCGLMQNATPKLLCCSDGSSLGSYGSFGWSFSTAQGHRFATCAGPAFGYKINSYRSEGYGILSALRFVFRAFEYTGGIIPLVDLYTDSESILKKIPTYQDYSDYFPNTTLDSDWDILQCIVSTIQVLSNKVKLHYVEGHQDRRR
jgi:hypothetical protein